MADPFDRDLLSAAELVEYDREGKLRGVRRIVGRVIGYTIALAAGVVVLVFALGALRTTGSGSGFESFMNVITIAGVLLLGYFGIMAIGSMINVETDLKKTAQIRQTIYLNKIGYEQRVRARKYQPSAPSDDNSNYKYTWLTGTYDPARYYSYSKSERDYMKMTGMDADTYDSNMPG